jgi:hypothetical protein
MSICPQYKYDVFLIRTLSHRGPSQATSVNAKPIPMAENPRLIEVSFEDAIALIAAAEELPAVTRQHWATSLRRIAKAFDKPLAVIPARYSAVRADLLALHAVPAGLTAKTLQNHKSNAKSALLWLRGKRASLSTGHRSAQPGRSSRPRSTTRTSAGGCPC